MWGDEYAENRDRRLVALAILLVLVLLGAGLGTIGLGGDGDTDQTPGVATETPPATATRDTPNATVNVSLRVEAERTLLDVSGAVPGNSGSGTLTLRNVGTDPGELLITSLAVDGGENGLTSPEVDAGDTADGGELADSVTVRLAVRYPDGTTVWVVGGESEFVPFSDVAAPDGPLGEGIPAGGTADIILDYRVVPSAGNEIQSDAVSFALSFTLRGTASPTATTVSG